jgi:hypothetical protein
MGVTGQQPGAVAVLTSMPAAVPARAAASSQLSLSDLTSIVSAPDDPILLTIMPTSIHSELPPSRFIAADGPAAHLREEGSSVHPSRLDDAADDDDEEELESLQSSLAVAMGRLRPVDATLRRLSRSPEVPAEYRHMAQHVRECAGLLL